MTVPLVIEVPAEIEVPAALIDAVARRVVEAVAPAPSARTPRLALNVTEACAVLGVGWDFWKAHVEPEIRIVRRGRRKLVAVAELQRWLDENAEPPEVS